MSRERSLTRGTSSVSFEHLATAPARKAHQVGLAAAAGEPAMGEGVTQLMRVKVVAQAGLTAALAEDLRDPAVGEATALPKP